MMRRLLLAMSLAGMIAGMSSVANANSPPDSAQIPVISSMNVGLPAPDLVLDTGPVFDLSATASAPTDVGAARAPDRAAQESDMISGKYLERTAAARGRPLAASRSGPSAACKHMAAARLNPQRRVMLRT